VAGDTSRPGGMRISTDAVPAGRRSDCLGDPAIEARYCKRVLAVLATAGLYEHSGQWLYDIGLPGKSGVSGGIVTVSPGKGGMGTFSPPLDAAGNSVRGQHITRYLSEALGLNPLRVATSGGPAVRRHAPCGRTGPAVWPPGEDS
jgi:Glutaminase